MGLKKLIRQWLDIEEPAQIVVSQEIIDPVNAGELADALALVSIGVGSGTSIHERHTVAAKRKHQAEPVIVDPNDPAALLRSLQS
jgi:hypothetical protein